MSGRLIGVRIYSASMDSSNIQTFAQEGTLVIIVDDLELLKGIGIDPKTVELVEVR